MDAKTTPAPTLAELLDYPVHPFAELFPKLSDPELDGLAADIKENGLKEPLLVRRDPRQLIDGRNRLDACHRVGIEPDVEFVDGSDEVIGAIIISRNVRRRHQSRGQLAMATAMILEPEKGGRGKLSRNRESLDRTDQNLLAQARKVMAFAPELVRNVLAGPTPLLTAYETAKTREQSVKAAEARLDALRKRSPEKASLVAEGSLDVEKAFAELDDSDRREKIIRDEGKRAVDSLTEIRTHVVSIKMAIDVGATGLLKAADVAVVAEAAAELQAMLKSEKGKGNVKA